MLIKIDQIDPEYSLELVGPYNLIRVGITFAADTFSGHGELCLRTRVDARVWESVREKLLGLALDVETDIKGATNFNHLRVTGVERIESLNAKGDYFVTGRVSRHDRAGNGTFIAACGLEFFVRSKWMDNTCFEFVETGEWVSLSAHGLSLWPFDLPGETCPEVFSR